MSSNKISQALLMLAVFLLPWQTRLIVHQGMIGRGQTEYLSLSLYGADVLLIVAFVGKVFSLCLDDNFESISNFKFQISKAFILLSAFFVSWCGLSIFWANSKNLAVQRVFWWALAMMLAWLIAKSRGKETFIFWFLAGLLPSALLGIWQFFFQSSFASKWLGLALHNPANGGVSIVEIYSANGQAIRWLRAYGSFDHPNVFGSVMALAIIFALYILLKKNVSKKKKLFLQICLVFYAAGLFASLSRSSWLGLATVLLALLAHMKIKKERASGQFFKYISIVGIVFAMCAWLYPAQFLMRSGGEGRLEKQSLDDRRLYLEQSKEIVGENMLLGVGAGNYIAYVAKNNPGSQAWEYQPVHNVPAYVLAELGVFGAFLLLTICIWLAIILWKADVLFFGAFMALLPSFLFDHWLWDLHTGILLVGIFLGLAFLNNKNSD